MPPPKESLYPKYEKVLVKRRRKDPLDRVGFYVEQVASCIPNAGFGVHLHGKAPKGTIVALYPGTVYAPGDPAFFQSLGNSYILRCYDGLLVDGNNGLSGSIFKSLYRRHHPDPHLDLIADQTWIEGGNVAIPPNVHYQELNIPPSFPLHLRKYVSNIHYAAAWRPWDDVVTRIVLLIANRDIDDEELFSTYHETPKTAQITSPSSDVRPLLSTVPVPSIIALNEEGEALSSSDLVYQGGDEGSKYTPGVGDSSDVQWVMLPPGQLPEGVKEEDVKKRFCSQPVDGVEQREHATRPVLRT
ncbi:hypothetical protein SpCBS45565_g06157 [Spizellomyces sp. 'palustris']|nr:hypothetical protein SpCBS45565_g06157 [Spizellomyces sp. 'palustris']